MTEESKTDRISRIIEAVRKAVGGDLSFRIEPSGENDEIDRFADTISRLLEIMREHIAGKMETEIALRDSEERYRRLKANIPGVVYLFALHPDGTFSFPYVNDASRQLFDLSPEDLMRDATLITRLVHPDDRERFYSSLKPSAETLQPWREILRFIVNGEVRWYDCMSRPELQPNGDILWDGIVLEITGRMHAVELLRESEQRLSDIISASPVGIAIYDGSGQCIAANDSLARMIGATEQQVLKQDYGKIESWKKSGLLDVAQTAVRTQSAKRHEVVTVSSFGREVFLDCHLVPFAVKGLLLVAQDITERKRVEEALRQSERKFRNIFDSSSDAILIHDTEGRFLEVNEVACKRLGYTRGELLQMVSMDIDTPEYADLVPERMQAIEEKGQMVFESAYVRKDGVKFPVEINSRKIDYGMKPCVLSVARDITERKQAEKEKAKLETQLQQAQKMESIGTLAGGIAHEFNNLLMGIQGRTSLMLMAKDASHPDFEHLRGIEDCIKNAAELTRQLLGFARAGKYEVKPVDINALIKKISTMFGRTKKEIAVNAKLQEGVWPVEVDQGQIDQVLMNLFVNAWQAMPGGGGLYLETENVTLDENYVKPFSTEPGRYVKISVTDTGVGMDKASQERIFDPFFTTKEVGRGTGLGLASAYGIIKNHGGFINVYSKKGHGTTFNVYLPASEKEVNEAKKPAGDALRGTETVLFVDDEDMVIEVVEMLLEQLNYRVLIARSGKEAIETYEENKERIDIVVLDMIMPDMSGDETYDRLKELNPEVRVLLSSGYSIDGRATEILERGCNGFIQKPFNMKELSQKLREILDEK